MKLNSNQSHEQGDDNHLSQLASVGQIAAGIAHEVKNPLTAVKGFLQLLQREKPHQYIDIAQSELESALAILNNLLQVSKPDLENEDYQTLKLSVEIEAILNLFLDKMYDIEMITEFKHPDALIYGKKNQLKRAFFNLIKNAIESIDGKGTVTVIQDIEDKDVVITIKDTGVGIPKEKLTLLGTPFFTTKEQGTGMGLAQVFSVIYQHEGKISVESKEKVGTTFTIKMPLNKKVRKRGIKRLELNYKENFSIKDFFLENRDHFEDKLLSEAINVKDKVEEIHSIGNINLLNNAHKLVLFVVEEREHELISFAKQEGIAWAKYSLTLAFKLEWIQAVRRTLWVFLYNYEVLKGTEADRDELFAMEKQINELIDQFLTHFFISYSKFKDGLLEEQRKMVENLSVPIIPINKEICILPLIGAIDNERISFILDKVLFEIEKQHIQTLIIDLSGVTPIDQEIAEQLMKITEGTLLMGCRSILTGLRADIVKGLVKFGGNYYSHAEFKGTLQLALNEVGFKQD
ncbi:rsbT co-antagonist protein RsbR [Pullulanibacillus pueri]|uniref:histidine kinase n=1 Tax=Pullulanibacillus pueri TaxID=1437324 RepID=A0A8J2ZTY9_9BACL|nr:ATP-binding protein [Pullulanibacillus pueri]MBM7680825.1 rsbT co-antagonist protein RsbR [Pullulanibacillus pueri]GGH78478.1 hypothetical protein GCM10007096_11970 [Pullulanibacillus pueri]